MSKRDISEGLNLFAWAKTVKTLDENTCVSCGSSHDIHAHHVYMKRYFWDIKYDPSFGATLCDNCDTYVHAGPGGYEPIVCYERFLQLLEARAQ